MEGKTTFNTKPYNRYGLFIFIYVILWILELIELTLIFTLLNSEANSDKTFIIIAMNFVLILSLIIMPFRFRNLQKKRNFGEINSKIYEFSKSSENFRSTNVSLNLIDLQTQLGTFFNISDQKGTIILDSKQIKDKTKVISVFIILALILDLFIVISVAFLNFGVAPSITLLFSGILLSVESYNAYNRRKTNYQLKINDQKLTVGVKLTNGKSRKLRSISLPNINYVTIESYRSYYRLKFSSKRKVISFLDHYNLEEAEVIYPILGKFITSIKGHTLTL